MSLTTAAGGFIIFLLSVSVIPGQDVWGVTYTSTEISALKGSTVELGCSYRYPPTENQLTEFERRVWFTEESDDAPVDLKTDSDYTGRVQYLFNENDCTLRIRDLTESDSAEYKFSFITKQPHQRFTGSPGVTLSVTDAPKLPSVSVSLSGEIVEGSLVTLTCSSDANLAAKYTWYKENGDLRPLSEEPQLVFSSIQSSDSGEYYCTAENKLGKETSESIAIDVKYAPKTSSVSVNPSGEIVEGSSVTLTCSSDANPAAKYTWYKQNGNPYLDPLRKDQQLVFSSIQSSDSGQYYCAAENKLGRTYGYVSIDVKYAPKTSSVSVNPSGEIMEGSSVTLTCSSDANPAAKYTWYKQNGKLYVDPLGEEPQLVFWSIQSSDSGQYYCAAQNKLGGWTSAYVSIDVKYAPKLPSVSVSPSGQIVEDSSVTLTCSSDAKPAASYTWYKKNRKPHLCKDPQLVLRSIQSSDSGEYYCTAKNKLGTRTSRYVSINVKYAPNLPSVSMSHSTEIVEGSSVILNCSSDANPAAKYTWYKNKKPHRRKEPRLVFSSIQSSDSGEYYCTAENNLRLKTSKSIFINVKYAPKRPSVSMNPSGEIVEGSSVTLTCSSDANPAAKYTWYKENQPLLPEPGPKGIYHFPSISSEDRGIYYCRADNQHGRINSTSLFVNVQYAPKRPSVSVSPSAEIMEDSSVTLTCSSDANPAANYTWYKQNEDSPAASGPIFTITDTRAEHSGNYSCEAQNRRGRHISTLYLTVGAGAWKLIAVATVPAVFLAIIFISVFLWIMKKKFSKQPSEPGERPVNREQCPQMQPAEQQDELHYASVHFTKRQTDPLYSNIRAAQSRRHKEEKKAEEEEEMVVYTAVKLSSAGPASRGEEVAEDPAAFYSTVNKKRNL